LRTGRTSLGSGLRSWPWPPGRFAGWAVAPGITKPAGPHTSITAAPGAGVPLRDVQEAATHAGSRTIMRRDRARGSLDRHATYIAGHVAGAT
jgi:hypothetical protein